MAPLLPPVAIQSMPPTANSGRRGMKSERLNQAAVQGVGDNQNGFAVGDAPEPDGHAGRTARGEERTVWRKRHAGDRIQRAVEVELRLARHRIPEAHLLTARPGQDRSRRTPGQAVHGMLFFEQQSGFSALDIPDAGRQAAAVARQSGTVRMERDDGFAHLAGLAAGRCLARGHVPHMNDMIAARSEALAVRAESQTANLRLRPLQNLDFLLRGKVPEVNGQGGVGAGEQAAVGAERQSGDLAIVGVEQNDRLPGANVPNACAPVPTGRDQEFSAGMPAQRRNAIGMSLESAQLLAGFEIPERDDPILVSRGEQGAVRANGEALDRSFAIAPLPRGKEEKMELNGESTDARRRPRNEWSRRRAPWPRAPGRDGRRRL